MVDIVWVGV